MLLDRILFHDKNMAWKEVAGKVVLMNRSRIFRLNEVGSFIWRQFDGQNTLKQIRHKVCEEFDVLQGPVEEDLKGLVVELETIGALKNG